MNKGHGATEPPGAWYLQTVAVDAHLYIRTRTTDSYVAVIPHAVDRQDGKPPRHCCEVGNSIVTAANAFGDLLRLVEELVVLEGPPLST